MAARTVAVRLTAEVASYVQGMKNASAATKDLASSTLDTAQKNKQAMTQVGTAITAMGAGLAVGVGMAVKQFADFDKAMSGVQAATHETEGNMQRLRDAALEAGARTAFSASEAAGGIEALAKAGVSTTAILEGGLAGALDLAAAGGLAVGDAAEIAATALTQFRLEGEQVPHVADLLAAAAGKAQGDVSDMGMALKQAGLVASQAGLSIEETTAGLASFASAGLIGSDAGTSFKSMLQRLTPQSQEAADLMQELGISAYDANGNFIGLSSVAENLQRSLGHLSVEQRNAAMATIFGSDAVRAASVLYQQGSRGIAEWTAKVNDAGYAQETAAIMLDNLAGDLEAFSGSVETAMIKTGSAGNDLARQAVQSATSVVNAYSSLPQSAQTTTLALGGIGAAVGLMGGAFLLALPRIAETREAMKTLSTEMPRAASAAGKVTSAIGKMAAFAAVTQVLNGLIQATDGAAVGVEEMTRRMLGSVNGLDKAFTTKSWQYELKGFEESIKTLTDPGLMKRLGDLGGEILTFGGNEGSFERTRIIEQIETMGAALGQMVSEGQADRAAELFEEFAAQAEAAGMSSRELMSMMPGYREALAGMANDAELGADAQGEMAGAIDEAAVAAAEQHEALGGLMEQIRALSDQVLGMRSAEREFEASIDAATEAVKKNGQNLDINTEKGRENEDALDAIASSANDVLTAMVEAGRPMDDVSAKMVVQRERLVAAATAFGMTEQQANEYAASVLRVPTQAQTTVALHGVDSAIAKVTAFREAISGIPSMKDVTVRYNEATGIQVRRPAGGQLVERAEGGWVFGPGSGTSDSIAARLSNGEFVVNARSAAQHGQLLEAINSQRFASGGWVGPRNFASGGSVSAPPQVSVSIADGMGWLSKFIDVRVDGQLADVATGASTGTWG